MLGHAWRDPGRARGRMAGAAFREARVRRAEVRRRDGTPLPATEGEAGRPGTAVGHGNGPSRTVGAATAWEPGRLGVSPAITVDHQ
ncbi:hypothetical protein STRAU_5547 [Streptomyces aurantiacus JA 4570]|uniref:Uncharacterized protein n=1 Tax=Streptomyces aurantiacus JA 4570 TaxID=1286094 RepID=S3ZC86_9ACTN|nr:hypothetical protein STRAU_5547 [Streptomyces aurantiacus JA 4570]